MSGNWSYDPDSLGDNGRDAVRFLVGDTDQDDPLIFDEEIDHCISITSSVYYAAAEAAEAISAKYSKKVTKSVGPLQIMLQERATAYADLAKRLRSTASRKTTAAPQYFGNSRSDKADVNSDPDRVGTAIRVGGMDNPSGPDTVRYWTGA